jgi:hypothetical protein
MYQNDCISHWIEQIEHNLHKFKNDDTIHTKEDKIAFITQQYHLLMIINKTLTGEFLFVGARPVSAPITKIG